MKTVVGSTLDDAAQQPNDSGMRSFISISMPASPRQNHLHYSKRIQFIDDERILSSEENPNASSAANGTEAYIDQKHHSQPMPQDTEAPKSENLHQWLGPRSRNPSIISSRDTTFDSFRTCPGKLERQLSCFNRKPTLEAEELNNTWNAGTDDIPVDRYFDALEGPELDTLKPSEELVLPEDRKWPFLLRFPISSFSICLGISIQAVLWKMLAISPSTSFLHVNLRVNFILWCISVALVVIVASIYSLKVIFYFEAVHREYCHPIRNNFFFAPWIALILLALSVPPSVNKTLPHFLWYVLMTPIFCLEVKIYGQWMLGGMRSLSKVANPSTHLAITGNFVGAMLGASMDLKEGPMFFFAIGLAHYLVLFVTLYQRLPTNETLPKELHPIFFLFVVPPSIVAVAWARIQGSFDCGSRIGYFIALFLFLSLVARIKFFRGFRFSLAWWAYIVPTTSVSISSIKYSDEVTNVMTQSLVVTLCVVSALMVTALLITTAVHAFVFHDLFPNDVAIAICERPPKPIWKLFDLRHASCSITVSTKDRSKQVNSHDGNMKTFLEPSSTNV